VQRLVCDLQAQLIQKTHPKLSCRVLSSIPSGLQQFIRS